MALSGKGLHNSHCCLQDVFLRMEHFKINCGDKVKMGKLIGVSIFLKSNVIHMNVT